MGLPKLARQHPYIESWPWFIFLVSGAAHYSQLSSCYHHNTDQFEWYFNQSEWYFKVHSQSNEVIRMIPCQQVPHILCTQATCGAGNDFKYFSAIVLYGVGIHLFNIHVLLFEIINNFFAESYQMLWTSVQLLKMVLSYC